MLVLLGANHRSAPVEIRERLALPSTALADRLRILAARDGIHAAYWLSTCNRVELMVDAHTRRGAVDTLATTLSDVSGLSSDRLERYLYRKDGGSVARHMFRVTSGLDSMILGEPQIAGQVREAYRQAREAGTLSSTLERLLQKALSTSKAVRTQTGISRHPVSVASTAVELARTIFGDLSSQAALLLGAGKMSGLMGEHLKGRGIRQLHVASRRFASAERLASTLGGQPRRWDDAVENLGDVDVLITGTAAMRRVLGVSDVQRAVRRRRGRPLLIVDIGVPRDVDPEVNELNNVYLYDIDALQSVVDRGLEERRRAARDAELKIDRAVDGWERWVRSSELAPTIATLTD
ncbi:MAG: glutamyl-tRNA reductase, partial [Planctomycetota bacterium]|nr:glutamyl-tRNA reductase [Planctomycetota bacterium]